MIKTRTVVSLFLCAGLAVIAPATLLQAQETANDETAARQLTLDDLRTFTDVFNQARRNYVENVDDKSLLDAAIRGMLSELDPHSGYLSPDDFEALDDYSRGRYSGIGVSLLAEDRQILVMEVVDGSPADESGMNPGDIITSIDGRPIKGRYVPDAVDELKGEPDTKVKLIVLAPDGSERELELTREYIRIPTLSFEMLDQSYGYFKMTQFHRDSAADLEQALDSIKAEGTELRGLVIDLRDNPGGVLQPAVNIADGFLDEGLIVTMRGRDSSMQMEFRAHQGDWLPGKPVVLLVDRGSASASEVLAGALQDHGRGLVIGERTFGKGSVQSVVPLRNGGGIKLTTARYYTPSGKSIQAEGILPDIEIDSFANSAHGDERVRESDLDRHLGRQHEEGKTERTLDKSTSAFPVDEILSVLDEAGLVGGPEEPETGAGNDPES